MMKEGEGIIITSLIDVKWMMRIGGGRVGRGQGRDGRDPGRDLGGVEIAIKGGTGTGIEVEVENGMGIRTEDGET